MTPSVLRRSSVAVRWEFEERVSRELQGADANLSVLPDARLEEE